MILPDGLDKVIINATLTNSGLQNLCTSWRLTKQDKYHNVQGNTVDRVAILYRCFMNQPDEDRESGRVSHIYDLADVCSSNGRGRLPIDRSAIIINRPYSGTWRISVEIVGVEDGCELEGDRVGYVEGGEVGVSLGQLLVGSSVGVVVGYD